MTSATPDRCCVYVVDHERIIATSLTTILRQDGFGATAFFDAREALHACESVAPKVLIAEVVLPEMNGVELALEVRQRYPLCQILLFTGHLVTDHLLEAARRRGYSFEVQSKPLAPAELLRRLRLIRLLW